MEEKLFNLMNIFEGYIRNYRRLNLYQSTNRSMFTKREIDYFANVGEVLGFFSYVEDSKPPLYGRSRPMDLSWWKLDERIDKDNFHSLILHLERENIYQKAEDTLDKLFAKTDKEFVPLNVIGIQNVEYLTKINSLNISVKKRNIKQGSNVLMIYRFYDKESDFDRVYGYYFIKDMLIEERRAICKLDETGYWTMCFEEEYVPLTPGKK